MVQLKMSASDLSRLPTFRRLSELCDSHPDKDKLTYTPPSYADDFSAIATYLNHIDRKVDKLYKLLLDAREDEFSDEELMASSDEDFVPSDYPHPAQSTSGPSGRPLKRTRTDFGPFPSFGPTDYPKILDVTKK